MKLATKFPVIIFTLINAFNDTNLFFTESRWSVWREVDSVKLSATLQELVKLNLDKYQDEDWNRIMLKILNRWGPTCHYDEHVRNLSQVLLIIASR